jgi:SEC-C motif domain protein
MKACPCNPQKSFEECCGPYLDGKTVPPTAETLMRSRYSAYVNKDHGYLFRTWHTSSQPSEESLNMPEDFSWTGLEILHTEAGEEGDESGTVEFKARYRTSTMVNSLHEKSSFVREEGQWYYVDGKTLTDQPLRSEKLGRNQPCHCGSGKKYKKCCLV